MIKYTRKGQVKMHCFLSKAIFSMEIDSPDKNLNLTVNNTYGQSFSFIFTE